MSTLTQSVPTSSSLSGFSAAKVCDRCAFAVLLTALLWAPWPLGSNRPWAVALLGMVLWLGVMLALTAFLLQLRVNVGLSGDSERGRSGNSGAAFGLAALQVNWHAARAVPLVAWAGFVAVLLLQMAPGWNADGSPLSIDIFQTQRYLFTTLVYAGGWLLVWLTVTSLKRATQLLGMVAAAGVLQASMAVVLYSGDGKYDLWFAAFEQGQRAMGTFVNPDHLAGYMELTLAAGLGWLISQFADAPAGQRVGWRHTTVALLDFLMSPKMLLRLLLILPVMALVMTHSRMGNAAFFVTLLLVGVLVAVRSQRLRKPALWLVVSMALVDVFIIGQWVGVDRVLERLKHTAQASVPADVPFGRGQGAPQREESLAQRLEMPKLSLQLVTAKPWFGHGGGTYALALPPFKEEHQTLHWDHAHNDFVQVASDTGLVGLALWLTIGVVSVWRAFQLVRDSQGRVHRGLGVAALMAAGCLAWHSMVDFNLHIPANALTFTVLLAAVWVLPGRKRSRRTST